MAISVDTTNKKTAKTASIGAPSLTISSFLVPTTTDPNAVLVVGVSLGTNDTVSAVTWNGQSLSQVSTATNGANCRSDLWKLVSPTPVGASSNILITFSAPVRAVATAFVINEVFTTTPFDAAMTATGNSQDATITYTNGANGDLAVIVIAKPNSTEATITGGTGTVQQGLDNTTDGTAANNIVHFMGTEPLTSASQVVDATWASTNRQWAAVVASANWAFATYTWQGAHQASLVGFGTVMNYGTNYDIPRAALVNYGGDMTLDTDGSISGTDDVRLLKV